MVRLNQTRSRVLAAVPAILSVAAALLIWELYVHLSGISPLVLPAPTRVIGQLVLHREMLQHHTLQTLRATLLGFSLSVATAFLFSIILDFVHPVRRALMPIFIISQTLPLVAIAPLVVLWFGFDLAPKIFLVALVTFFPMLIALVDGYAATDRQILALLRVMRASRWQIFMIARLPSALPYFFAGLRISITYAVVAAIFSEYVGARAGLGIVILNAKNNFRPDLVLAAVLISSFLTMMLFALSSLIRLRLLRWHGKGGRP